MDVIFNRSHQRHQLPDEVGPLAVAAGSGMMDPSELLHLAATLAAFPWDGRAIVVEIGAYVGRTTVFMAEVLRLLGHRVPILSIDPFEAVQPDPLNPQGIFSAYAATVQASGSAGMCLPLLAFSTDAAPVVPDWIGVLVVDGGHHYPTVSRDLALYAPKVLPGGLIFIDDYGPAYPDVVRAVDEYFSGQAPFTVLHVSYFVVAVRS